MTRKMILIVISMIILSFGATSSFAIDDDSYDQKQEEYGVSTVCPEDFVEPGDDMIQPNGKNIPAGSKVHNIIDNGKYEFSGSAKLHAMYTDKWITGKSQYKIVVENTGEFPLKVTAKRRTKTYASTTVSAGKTATIEFSGIKKSTKFYIKFANGVFNGYVK